eukprot:NODE_5276_length_596_cov_269.720887.p1 GENE.NODE_5276_length_596_cov_269.720887~~NODE_5276_length_596_cov_269.720887.p1  ORF type:complete len:166 (-),score=56.51 NODE_5276_length_596_cov_269.720887:47-544(-)
MGVEQELKSANDNEESAQQTYDTLTAETATDVDAAKVRKLKLEGDLADTRKQIDEMTENLGIAQDSHTAIGKYLEEIKPGCDFIQANLELRNSNRAEETTALEKAIELIKGSPAYLKFERDREHAGLGSCKDACAGKEEHVECKACLARVEIAGYCAGHPGTEGC